MKIDVTTLMNHRESKIDFDYRFDPEHTDVECVALQKDVRVKPDGIHVVGILEDSLGCMTFRAHVSVEYTTPCARCLDEVCATAELDMERVILTERSGAGSSHLSDDDEWDGVLDDYLYVNEARIIPDADIIEEISLELPSFVLCSNDCPGLCQKCGKRLKDGDCGCKNEKEINPKFAILQKLLENQE